jgi:glycosyltransferase involved in cell wall biosynthesis
VKVLHVETGRHLYGGARQVVYLLEGLKRRGVDSVLVCARDGVIEQAAAPWVSRCYALPMGGDLDLRLVWRLRQIIASERPDIVHLHSRRGADLLGGLAARFCGVKCVLSRRVDNREPRWWVAWKYRLYHRVITISQGIHDVLVGEGVPPAKLACVRSAVSPEAFAQTCDRAWFHKAFPLSQDVLTLAVIAQLIPRKGHRYLLQALPELLKAFPTLRLLLFGQGAEESRLRAQVDTLGLTDRVTFAGFRTDLPQILPCLDLVVHPALMEGLGISLLQAAAAGVPIVAVAAGGMPEVVRDGVNGLLVPPADSPALAAAINRLLADPGLRRRFGAAGKELVREKFSVAGMVEGNLQVYWQLLDNNNDANL